MPYKFRRISEKKRRQILQCFAEDISATQTAHITGLNRNTINDWYCAFHEKILEYQEQENRSFYGGVKLGGSYFGGLQKKKHAGNERNRGRGAENKGAIPGVLKVIIADLLV